MHSHTHTPPPTSSSTHDTSASVFNGQYGAARCLQVPVKKQGTFCALAARVQSYWTRRSAVSFPGLLFAERAHAVLASTRFTFMQFQIFMAESLLVPPRTAGVGHSAASLRHYSLAFPTLLHHWEIPPFQKPFCSHPKHRIRSYIRRRQGLIGPNARGSSTESQQRFR